MFLAEDNYWLKLAINIRDKSVKDVRCLKEKTLYMCFLSQHKSNKLSRGIHPSLSLVSSYCLIKQRFLLFSCWTLTIWKSQHRYQHQKKHHGVCIVCRYNITNYWHRAVPMLWSQLCGLGFRCYRIPAWPSANAFAPLGKHTHHSIHRVKKSRIKTDIHMCCGNKGCSEKCICSEDITVCAPR